MTAPNPEYTGWTWERMLQDVLNEGRDGTDQGSGTLIDRDLVAGHGVSWVRFVERRTQELDRGTRPTVDPGDRELMGYRRIGPGVDDPQRDLWEIVRGHVTFWEGTGGPPPATAFDSFYRASVNALTRLYAGANGWFSERSFTDAGNLLWRVEQTLLTTAAELRVLRDGINGTGSGFAGSASAVFVAALTTLHADIDRLTRDMNATNEANAWSDRVFRQSNDLLMFRERINDAWREFSDHTHQWFNTYHPTTLFSTVRSVLAQADQGSLNAVRVTIPDTYGTGPVGGTFDLTTAAGWTGLDVLLRTAWLRQLVRLDLAMRDALAQLVAALRETGGIVNRFTGPSGGGTPPPSGSPDGPTDGPPPRDEVRFTSTGFDGAGFDGTGSGASGGGGSDLAFSSSSAAGGSGGMPTGGPVAIGAVGALGGGGFGGAGFSTLGAGNPAGGSGAAGSPGVTAEIGTSGLAGDGVGAVAALGRTGVGGWGGGALAGVGGLAGGVGPVIGGRVAGGVPDGDRRSGGALGDWADGGVDIGDLADGPVALPSRAALGGSAVGRELAALLAGPLGGAGGAGSPAGSGLPGVGTSGGAGGQGMSSATGGGSPTAGPLGGRPVGPPLLPSVGAPGGRGTGDDARRSTRLTEDDQSWGADPTCTAAVVGRTDPPRRRPAATPVEVGEVPAAGPVVHGREQAHGRG
ncbi:hypothetical protein [Micromonospora rifamycinica]|uniref:Uncharacterized protein n=1 Tax=Micromonospora rifamycinica TaxID=291594 RepID=A0A109IKY7_9ACTN|nr:hypothetical protein [Micromonospora rifamycinica]KWV32368.1 hypothetical protein AWV63_12745 [Micromonospora rifamycinica]SCG46538.1 hypothetical protein GA0070623_1374 [Micromonospora rifamycinica]